jgi:SAM-dependent methyltransferase
MNESYYNYLAEDYNHKRRKPWKALEDFLQKIDINKLGSSGYCLDIGCGNGRNFPLISFTSNHIIGLDNSIELLKFAQKNANSFIEKKIERKPHIQLTLCSLDLLPIRSKTINSAYVIAVIHHIKKSKNRKVIMQQIYNIIKDNGWVIVSVWRKFQRKYRWFFFKDLMKRALLHNYSKLQAKEGLGEFGDKLVPWTLSKEGKTYLRFYHFFSYKEAKKLMNDFKIEDITKLGGPGKKDNFFFLLRKGN